MNTKLTKDVIKSFKRFGVLYQLPEPNPEYVIAIQEYLSVHKWRLCEFNAVLNMLLRDEKYAETARFNKYPAISDFFRIKQQMDSKPFYDALSAYLSGSWWEKDTVLALATPEQENAIMASGGLSKLYERANGEMATPVYKLVDIVAQNESEAPVELIDTEHRIGKPQTMQQITAEIQKDKPKEKKIY